MSTDDRKDKISKVLKDKGKFVGGFGCSFYFFFKNKLGSKSSCK